MQRKFSRIADRITEWTGSIWASVIAVVLVLSWLLGLLHFGLGDQNYDVVISTGTTIVTFVMVFLIQHSTNRGSRAVQLKLDALIAAQEETENKLMGAEELPEVEIKNLQAEARAQMEEAVEEAIEEVESDRG